MHPAALIPLFPLAAFAIIILAGRRLGWVSCLVAVAGCALSTGVAMPIIFDMVGQAHPETQAWSFEWLRWGDDTFRMGVRVDALTALMLFFVTVIGTLIVIYAVGYMAGDPNFTRFFAFVSLFMAGMLGLVVADNLLLLFVSWEIMGVCSYFLISFYFKKPSAAAAGMKAFITTRIGDVGLMIGMFLLWWTTGTVHFERLIAVMGAHPAETALLTAAAILIFVGTIGKSAQFPLHVWLPDAMEGPTPVSALIHAATMVSAGVYLVARAFMIFHALPVAMNVVAHIGGFTALFAALIALTQTDIKRVLAFSTMSQLGYMVMALGLGAYAAGVFHLMTHAFFKALLFLGAGAVIHGFHHVQDMRQMGGLARKMPITCVTILLATLAIAGFPGFSGFWSKDEILLGAFEGHHWVLWSAGTFTAFLTAFYMFRLFFMTFTGEQRDKSVHAHESPLVMTAPLMVLAFFAVVIGLPGSPLMGFWLQGWLQPEFLEHHEHHVNPLVMSISTAVAFAGIALAWMMYRAKPLISPARLAERFAFAHRLSLNKFYFDELYAKTLIEPTKRLAHALFAFDQDAIDGVGVNGTGFGVRTLARVARRFTAGNLQWYAVSLVIGVIALAAFALRVWGVV